MSKYIKLEDAIHVIAENMALAANLKEHCNEPTFCAGEFLVEAELLVKDLPTIEVNDGEWVEDEYGIARCSECNCINNTFYRNYCPNCGAIMRR